MLQTRHETRPDANSGVNANKYYRGTTDLPTNAARLPSPREGELIYTLLGPIH